MPQAAKFGWAKPLREFARSGVQIQDTRHQSRRQRTESRCLMLDVWYNQVDIVDRKRFKAGEAEAEREGRWRGKGTGDRGQGTEVGRRTTEEDDGGRDEKKIKNQKAKIKNAAYVKRIRAWIRQAHHRWVRHAHHRLRTSVFLVIGFFRC